MGPECVQRVCAVCGAGTETSPCTNPQAYKPTLKSPPHSTSSHFLGFGSILQDSPPFAHLISLSSASAAAPTSRAAESEYGRRGLLLCALHDLLTECGALLTPLAVFLLPWRFFPPDLSPWGCSAASQGLVYPPRVPAVLCLLEAQQ